MFFTKSQRWKARLSWESCCYVASANNGDNESQNHRLDMKIGEWRVACRGSYTINNIRPSAITSYLINLMITPASCTPWRGNKNTNDDDDARRVEAACRRDETGARREPSSYTPINRSDFLKYLEMIIKKVKVNKNKDGVDRITVEITIWCNIISAKKKCDFEKKIFKK